MRGLNARALLEQIAQKDRERPVEESMEMWVETHGAAAAGWLIGKHRGRIHRYGAADFEVPEGVAKPPWLRVAIETLRRRQKWTVVELPMKKGKVIRVRWLHWGRYATKVKSVGQLS